MFDKVLISRQVPGINLECFFRATGIYLFKPHVVNRKLFGASNLHTFSYRYREGDSAELLDVAGLLADIKEQVAGNLEKVVQNVENACKGQKLQSVQTVDEFDLNKLDFSGQPKDSGFVVINRFLPRNLTVFRPLDVLAVIGK